MGLLLGSLLLSPLACDDKRRHATADAALLPTASAPVPLDATPVDVTRALFLKLREAQLARENGLGPPENKRRYETAMSDLRALAAAEHIPADVKAAKVPTLPRDISPEAALTLAVESWISTGAYYIDGLQWETMSQSGSNANLAIVRVEAERPHDAYRLSQLIAQAEANPTGQGAQGGTPPSPAGLDSLRTASLQSAPPFNVPIRALFSVGLVREGGAWRVRTVHIGPGGMSEVGSPERPPVSAPVPPLAPAGG
jgi:hypothetical protein